MKIRSAELETVCGITSVLPENDRPEVAFAGKSNVGKSSLINALLGRKSLARVSQRPGKTQTINFYHINPGTTEEETEERLFAPDMYLVDLPGYGFANVPEAEKAKWGTMIERYLHTSKALKAVFLLIDLRHPPTGNDRQMYGWILKNGFVPIIVGTKADKLKRSQLPQAVKAVRTGLGMKKGDILVATSSETKDGIEELWETMKNCAYAQEERFT